MFHGYGAAMSQLMENRGYILNTGSVSGLGDDWGMGFYNASKGTIINFTKAVVLDHGKDGLRVNAVCRSPTFTTMTEGMLAMGGFRRLAHNQRNETREPCEPMSSEATPAR